VDLLYPRSLEPVPMAGSLSLRATVTGLGDKTSRIVDASGSTASFEQTLISAPVPKGLWTVEVAPVNTATAKVVDLFRKQVYVDNLPIISRVSLDPPLAPRGGLLRVRVEINGDPGLLNEAGVFYELRDSQRRRLNEGQFTVERDTQNEPTGAYTGLVEVPETLSPSGGDADAAAPGWLDSALAAISPFQGRATLTVTLAGYYRPSGTQETLRYEDAVAKTVSLALPHWRTGVALGVIILVQMLCLWPGRPQVGELTLTDSAGFIQTRARVSRLSLGGGTVVKAVPRMLTRFNWAGVESRAEVRVDRDLLDDLARGDMARQVPAGDTYYTIANTSAYDRQGAPLGLAGHLLAGVGLLASAALVLAVLLPGGVRLGGLAGAVLVALCGLNILGLALWLWLGWRCQTLGR